MIEIFIYIAIGTIAGVFSGLLGISGGVITIPLLAIVFGSIGLSAELEMHLAIGTSLSAMVFNSLSSMIAHHKKNNVIWKLVLQMLPGIAVGAILGALTAYLLPDKLLETIFGVFLFILGIYFFFVKDPSVESHRIPPLFSLSIIALFVGYFANILGIGGGIILVPLFTFFHLSFVKAIGTSVTITFFSSIVGASSYLYFGSQSTATLPMTYGFVYLPAFLVISIVSFVLAYFGAKLASHIKQKNLRKWFSLILISISFIMLLR